MILIADGGSTKTEWCLWDAERKTDSRFFTEGMNPYFQTQKNLRAVVEDSLLPQLADYDVERIGKVCYYGAGCTKEKSSVVSDVLRAVFVSAEVQVHSDMLAVAHALCGNRPGIACILGTGSNSCFYDGRDIVKNVSPLGFILGDEGSGAVLGRLLVGDLLKNQLADSLKDKFLSQYHLTQDEIIERVYRQPFPNRFLASLSPFIAENLHEPGLYRLVYDSFTSFLRRNVMQYDVKKYAVGFSGSVAFYYKEVLCEAANNLHINIGGIVRGPMDGLVSFYSPGR